MDRLGRRRKTDINAVYEDDIRPFLDRYGLAERYDDGSFACVICERSLKEFGVGAAREREGALVVACSRFDCIRELT